MITTFLTIIAETQYFNQEMPKVSYIKAIDIWMFVCIAFVFMSTIEYSVAHIYLRHEQSRAENYKENEELEENLGIVPKCSNGPEIEENGIRRAR